MLPQRHGDVERLVGQLLADDDLLAGVVDDHRQADRERRERLRLRRGEAAERGALDQRGEIPDAEGAELERLEPARLQASEADLADAGAQRGADGAHAELLRDGLRQHRLLGPGVDHEVDHVAAVDPALNDDLLVDQPERNGVKLPRRHHLDRGAVPERPQELHLGPRPVRPLAIGPAGNQLDVPLVGVGRVGEPAHAPVDVPQRVIRRGQVGGGVEGRLHPVQSLPVALAGREALRQAVPGRAGCRVEGQRVAVQLLRLVEQPPAPQCVTDEGDHLGIVRGELQKHLRLDLRAGELGDGQQRPQHAGGGAHALIVDGPFLRFLEGANRLPVAHVVEQQVAELNAGLHPRRGRRRLRAEDNRQGRRHHHEHQGA